MDTRSSFACFGLFRTKSRLDVWASIEADVSNTAKIAHAKVFLYARLNKLTTAPGLTDETRWSQAWIP